jgi:hypothetical protein
VYEFWFDNVVRASMEAEEALVSPVTMTERESGAEHMENSLVIWTLWSHLGALAVIPRQDHIRVPAVVFATSRWAASVSPLGVLLLGSLGVLSSPSNVSGNFKRSHFRRTG